MVTRLTNTRPGAGGEQRATQSPDEDSHYNICGRGPLYYTVISTGSGSTSSLDLPGSDNFLMSLRYRWIS